MTRHRITALAVAALAGLLTLAVAPAPAPAADLEAPPGSQWRQISFFLDATGSFFSPRCSGSYFGIGVVTCDGHYTDPSGTPPFNEGDGTVSMVHNFDTPLFMTIYHVGAQLDGWVPNDDSSPRLNLTSGVTSWGTGIRSGNDPGIAAGEQGGPLYLDVEADYGYSFRVHGWVLYDPSPAGSPPGQEPPTTTTTEAPAPAPEPGTTPTSAPAPVAAPVATPRFTG